jgi:hypothetical protein
MEHTVSLKSSHCSKFAFTGSVFELSGGNPQYGSAVTASIVGVSIPLCLFLFYASVKKAQAETEEDDKEFMKGK